MIYSISLYYTNVFISLGRVKGEFDVQGVLVSRKLASEADNQEFAFELGCKDGEKILLAGKSDEEVIDWMDTFASVADGSWKLFSRLKIIGELIGLDSNQKITVEADKAVLVPLMIEAGYTSDRFSEIYYETYFDTLIAHLRRFIVSIHSIYSLFTHFLCLNLLLLFLICVLIIKYAQYFNFLLVFIS